jgi:hypothetical protein
VEIKYGKDRMSEAQKGYENIIGKTGGVYIIVKNIDGFFDWYCNFIKTNI